MKTNFTVFLIIICSLCFAQPVKISGKIIDSYNTGLTQLTNIAQKNIAVKVNKEGFFAETFAISQSGCYLLPAVGHLYLESGYDLNMMPNKDSDYVFTGKGSLENNLIVKTKKMLGDYFSMGNNGILPGTIGFTYSVYTIEPDSFLHKMDAYKNKALFMLDQSQSTNFKTIAKGDIDFYCRSMLSNYLTFYGIDSVKWQKLLTFMSDSAAKTTPMRMMNMTMEAYNKRMEPTQMSKLFDMQSDDVSMNDSLLFINSEEYRKTIDAKVDQLRNKRYVAGMSLPLLKLRAVQKNITNSVIHDYYTYTLSSDIIKASKDSVLIDSIYHDFLVHTTNPSYLENINKLYNNYLAVGTNKAAPDFNFINTEGKTVSLKSLKGKYVYIDVWATWCEPCKNEIPYLSTLETEYEKKNIQFVSLSVDFQKDKNKWLDYVRTKKLKGIQLMADNAFESEFIQKFNINSIPRFILISPDGKIVSANALRPSDIALRSTFDSLL